MFRGQGVMISESQIQKYKHQYINTDYNFGACTPLYFLNSFLCQLTLETNQNS